MTDLSQALEELMYRSYRAQRDNGADHGLLQRSGVYGDSVDNFADRYYDEQKAEETDSDAPTLLEWQVNEHGLGAL